jgi:quercetin dioxygenase-like cupin family protein
VERYRIHRPVTPEESQWIRDAIMSVLERPLLVDGKLWGVTWHFEKVGDVFPIHTHTEDNNHITIVSHGSIKLLGKHEGKTLTAQPGGTIVNWPVGEPHGFEALTNGATLTNIFKNLKP